MEEDYRNLCQVFTPIKNVKELLDWCGYKHELYGKKIIENSCGDGNILKEVVKRYIDDCIQKGFTNSEISKGLENDIYAIEYDEQQFEKCKTNLNKILEQYGFSKLKWKNLKNDDTLKSIYKEKFDYVVGNPPYIKYKSLSIEDREYIRKNYITCKNGKFDYCYAFIENSIKSLKNSGKMAYLIPSSIFKNVFANDLRNFIKPHIIKIYDYTVTKLFDKNTNVKGTDRLVSSVIMILEKNSDNNYLEYIDINKNETIIIDKKDLDDKWIFRNRIKDIENKIKFGEFFLASNTIATLYNDGFVIKEYIEDDNFIYPPIGGKIEKKVVKDTISPKSFSKEKVEKIIFPYYYNKNNDLVRYDTQEFEREFPNTCEYLKKFEKKLQNRKSDKNAKWFEYGRSQALKNSNNEKLLLSTVITDRVKTKILPKDNIPYSGIYIIPIKDKTLKEAEEILKSKEFFEYIEGKGINASGNSLRITAKDINEYMF
ncbi:MAG: SAM-dependent methyltransferase [Clostridia bacterium]|nr:SAM-dependent methyltransferase [Clostridia bacterium]